MLLPVAQYAFFFWLVVGNNNGEVLRARHMEQVDQNTYRIAACTIRCMQQQPYKQQQQQSAKPSYLQPQQLSQLQQKLEKSHFEHCFEYCDNASAASKRQDNLRKIYENLSLNLICRDDSSLTFRIDTERRRAEAAESGSNHSEITTKHTDTPAALPLTATKGTTTLAANKNHTVETIYFVKIHDDKDADNYDVYLSDDNFFTLKELQENATHSLSVVAVHANNEYSVITKEQQYHTLRRGYTPGMVTDIQVREFSADETSELHLFAKLTWKPAADMTCHYDIICFSPESSEYVLTPLEIRNPRQLYTHTLQNLTFSSSYKVGIRAINSNNGAKESELFWRNFEAPSCMEWFNNNFNICAPLRPTGLEVEQIFVGESAFALNISWQQPEHLPDYYIVRVLDLDVNGNTSVYNVSKQSTGLYIPNVTLHGIMYEVHLTAYTHGGNATALITDMAKSVVLVPDKNHVVKLIAAILAPIFCIVILSLTIFIICHRRAKLKRYQERCKYFEELEKKAPIDPKAAFEFTTKTLPRLTSPEDLTLFQLDLEEKILFNDAMEIDRKDLTLLEVLGEGAFGLVRRGVYSDNKFGPRQIAVKMLKDQPSADDERAFRREIEVMKSVEKHPNIVGLIGHCTKRNSEMMLLTEYCSFGNLQDFLRDEWKYLYELNLQCKAKAAAPRLPARMHTSGATRNAVQQLSSSDGGSASNNNNSNSNPKNISLFNIDASLIEKLKLKYKSLSANQLQANSSSSSSSKNGTTSVIHIEDLAGTTTTTTAAADNKSYGYDESCTNACKCQVNVLIRSLDGSAASAEAEQLECVLQQKAQHVTNTSATTTTAAASKTIEVQNCECRQLLSLARKNRRNAAATAATTAAALQSSVENSAYYKYMPVENAQQHHQQQLRQRQRQLQDSGNAGDSMETCFKRVPLSAGDLLDIAKQVAVGMEFLAKNKVVHRDLAARNVLVAADRTVKIADFGLSRDIYQENIYKKTGNGKLPIKWLALESMTHQVYTTQSDVWSYGILLYEIVTLGGTPYPSIATNRLLHLLKTGYRMEKPKNCGQDFYNLMHSCWHVNPGERPNFTEIIKNLDNLLSDAPQQQISNVLSVPKAQKVEVASSDDSYLKPL